MRAIAFVIIGLAFGRLHQETIEPNGRSAGSARQQLMSICLAQGLDSEPSNDIVEYTRKETPGTIVVDSDHQFLYTCCEG